MDINNLTKEQKQYIVLGIMVGAGVIALAVFGIKLSLSSIAEKRTELDEVTGKIEKAERALAKQRANSEAYFLSIDRLRGYEEQMPPVKNYYSWATEIIYAHGRRIGLEVDAVDEVPVATKKKPADKVVLESYMLRIAAQGSFSEISSFLKNLVADQPLLRVTAVNISSTQNPEVQTAQLFVQWPFGVEALSKGWAAAERNKLSIQKRETANRSSADAQKKAALDVGKNEPVGG